MSAGRDGFMGKQAGWHWGCLISSSAPAGTNVFGEGLLWQLLTFNSGVREGWGS